MKFLLFLLSTLKTMTMLDTLIPRETNGIRKIFVFRTCCVHLKTEWTFVEELMMKILFLSWKISLLRELCLSLIGVSRDTVQLLGSLKESYLDQLWIPKLQSNIREDSTSFKHQKNEIFSSQILKGSKMRQLSSLRYFQRLSNLMLQLSSTQMLRIKPYKDIAQFH